MFFIYWFPEHRRSQIIYMIHLLPYSLFSLSFKSRAVNAQSKYSDLRLSIDFRKVVDCGAWWSPISFSQLCVLSLSLSLFIYQYWNSHSKNTRIVSNISIYKGNCCFLICSTLFLMQLHCFKRMHCCGGGMFLMLVKRPADWI